MDAKLVFERTEKGNQELATRKYHIAPRMRWALILVDGHSDVDHLHAKANRIDDLDGLIEALAVDGFIRATGSDWDEVEVPSESGTVSVADVRAKLIDLAIMILGEHADPVVKRLREAGDDWAKLKTILPECKKIAALIVDEQTAKELHAKCLRVLNAAAPPATAGLSLSERRARLVLGAQKLLEAQAANVVAKLESAPLTEEGLRASADKCAKLIALTIDEDKAAVFTKLCIELLD